MNGPRHKAVNVAGSPIVACTKNTAIYTDAFDRANLSGMALSIILAGTGAVSCKVELEQSYKLPATENIADANWVVPDGAADVVTNLAVKTQRHIALSPVTMRYVRLKITELTNVSTDTVATAWFSYMNAFEMAGG